MNKAVKHLGMECQPHLVLRASAPHDPSWIWDWICAYLDG